MECKVVSLSDFMDPSSVLIETLWNVKKPEEKPIDIEAMCINRNIVECKVSLIRMLAKLAASINRNIVECKVFISVAGHAPFHVLIETLWNVKIKCTAKKST